MEIKLVKFGSALIFRDRGREAFSAFEPNLSKVSEGEEVVIDFDGVLSFAPSWGDEFLTPLVKRFGEKLILKNSGNASVKATLKILNESKGLVFNVVS